MRTSWLKIDNVIPAEDLSVSCKVLILPLHNAEHKTLKPMTEFIAYMLKTWYVILTGT